MSALYPERGGAFLFSGFSPAFLRFSFPFLLLFSGFQSEEKYKKRKRKGKEKYKKSEEKYKKSIRKAKKRRRKEKKSIRKV